jgi:hypothetical protein
MNEPLLERIRQRERRVKRWRLISLALALLLILAIAVGGILTVMPATREPGGFWLWLPWVRARHQEEMARREADALRQQIEAAKQREQQAVPAGENRQAP